MNQKIIVVGSGIAALSAAEAARAQDKSATVVMLSRENVLPYYRLRVAEVLKDSAAEKNLYLHDQAYYDDLKIEVRLNTEVSSVDRDSKTVKLAAGESINYDKLIVAAGSRSRLPGLVGEESDRVFTLWTMADAKAFSEAIEAKNIRSCVIIGSGVLGLEAAWQLHQRGVKVSLLEFAPHILARQLTPAASELLTAYIESLGMKVYTGADTEVLASSTDSQTAVEVRLKDGRVVASDAVLLSVGVLANTEMAVAADLPVNRRIVVDSRMQTADPDVYAAGDVCEVDKEGYWFGLWSVSMQQGKVAGANAAGGDQTFNKIIPPYIVNTMKTRIVSQGTFPEADEAGVRHEEEVDRETYSYRKLYFKDDQLVGFNLIGEAAKEMAALQKELQK